MLRAVYDVMVAVRILYFHVGAFWEHVKGKEMVVIL
jgi:hypothetical protein